MNEQLDSGHGQEISKVHEALFVASVSRFEDLFNPSALVLQPVPIEEGYMMDTKIEEAFFEIGNKHISIEKRMTLIDAGEGYELDGTSWHINIYESLASYEGGINSSFVKQHVISVDESERNPMPPTCTINYLLIDPETKEVQVIGPGLPQATLDNLRAEEDPDRRFEILLAANNDIEMRTQELSIITGTDHPDRFTLQQFCDAMVLLSELGPEHQVQVYSE